LAACATESAGWAARLRALTLALNLFRGGTCNPLVSHRHWQGPASNTTRVPAAPSVPIVLAAAPRKLRAVGQERFTQRQSVEASDPPCVSSRTETRQRSRERRLQSSGLILYA